MKLAYVFCLFCLPLVAQMPGEERPGVARPPDETSSPTPQDLRGEMVSLEALNDSISRREQEIEALYRRRNATEDAAQRDRMLPELDRLNKEIESLRSSFQSTAALKTDISIFEGEPKKEFDLQSELEQLLQPILAEIKAATKDSREREELNRQLDLNQTRQQTAQSALDSLALLLEANTDPDLTNRLKELQDLWENRLQDADNQITVIEHHLRQREEDDTSLLQKTKGIASGFVRSRGLNLTVGVLAFLAVFLSMRGVQWSWLKFRPQPKKGRSFSSRLLTLIWTILTGFQSGRRLVPAEFDPGLSGGGRLGGHENPALFH
jgi:hypothetical protein